jgi:hypothetical protein
MSEKTTCPSKCIWSRVFPGAIAFVLLAAVPVLALPVLGADVFSLTPAAGEVIQSPLTFDAPTTNLLKVKPAPGTAGEKLVGANADAVLLTKWKYSFDLLTALQLGESPTIIVINTGPSDLTQQLLLLTSLFALQDNLLASAPPALVPSLLTLFTQQNAILAALLGLPTTGF